MEIRQRIKEIWAKRPTWKRSGFSEGGEEKPIHSIMEYKERLERYRRSKIFRIGGICVAVLLLLVIGKSVVDHWKYNDYKILSEETIEDTLSASYTEFDAYILKYSGDNVALLNRQGEILWDEPQTMSYPTVVCCEKYCLVYDKRGSVITLFDASGKVNTLEVDYPIIKATVCDQGVIAAVLEDGETTWVNVYDSDGDSIVTAKTSVDSPGYPVDLSLSEDGLLMAVSYLCVENTQPASYIAFYNFGNTGQNQMDNMVSAYTYVDVIVPQVTYMSGSRAIAIRDDGFAVYKGKQIPEEEKLVEVENEILSTVSDENYLGMVFREDDGDSAYRLELYRASGAYCWSAGIDIAFDHIVFSDNQILLYNNSEFAVYTKKGYCRYQGGWDDGNIQSMFKVGRNRYMVVTDNGIKTIKLSM